MTGLAGIFYVKDQSEKKSALIYIATAFIILAHGMLHWFLQQDKLDIVVNCYNPNLGGDIEEVGTILFAAFSFFLALIILGIGFGALQSPHEIPSLKSTKEQRVERVTLVKRSATIKARKCFKEIVQLKCLSQNGYGKCVPRWVIPCSNWF